MNNTRTDSSLTDLERLEAVIAAFQSLSEGREQFNNATTGMYRDNHLAQQPDFASLMALMQLMAMQQIIEEAMSMILLADLLQLTQMSQEPTVEPVLRKVLGETLSNKDQINFRGTYDTGAMPMVPAMGPRAGAPTNRMYHVDVNMDQAGGQPERLGSLIRRMTYVSNNATFKNTALHLAFPPSMQDDEVLRLSRTRTQHMSWLIDGLKHRPSGSFSFTRGQLNTLSENLRYPIATSGSGTLMSYTDRFYNKNYQLTEGDRDRIMGLAAAGANNTLVEFDPAINQMLFMMNAWNVPQGDPFYGMLKQVGQQAYDWRNNGKMPEPLGDPLPAAAPRVDAY